MLKVLAAQRIAVPADARSRVTACTDLDQLDVRLTRAVTITTIDELFA